MAATQHRIGHHLRAWRKASGLTLEQAADRVARVSEARADLDAYARPMSMTHATLSRIERGRLPYNQALLEILAEVYRTDRASLIMRDPPPTRRGYGRSGSSSSRCSAARRWRC